MKETRKAGKLALCDICENTYDKLYAQMKKAKGLIGKTFSKSGK